MRFATMHMKTLPFTVSTAVLFLMQPNHSSASEEEHEHEEHLGTSAIWGYSFLFNFLGCLPSAFAIVICLWAKLKIADKVITNLTSFASGVSFASTSLSALHPHLYQHILLLLIIFLTTRMSNDSTTTGSTWGLSLSPSSRYRPRF
jgi:hypothetical protein